MYSKVHPGKVCSPETLAVTVRSSPRYHLMLRRLLQIQGGNSLGIGKETGQLPGLELVLLRLLQPGALQLPRPPLGQLAALRCWWVAAGAEGELGTRGTERWPCHGEVVLLEEAAAWERQGRAAHARLGFLAGGGWDRGGWGSKGRSGICFLSLHLPSNSYRLCTFLLRRPRVRFCYCISISDMANINQITLKGKRELQQRWRLSSPPRQTVESWSGRGLSQGSSPFVLTAMVCWRRRGGCSSTRRGEV